MSKADPAAKSSSSAVTGASKPPAGDAEHHDLGGHAPAGLRGWLIRLSEPQILFPVITVVVLGVIWSSVFNLIKTERANADVASMASSLELVNTYEAQVVRALGEIDKTLRFVKYVYETGGAAARLLDLKAGKLLPPDLLFAVSIVNRDGTIAVSTRPAAASSAADQGYLAVLRANDTLWVSRPEKARLTGEWTVQFARRINSADGAFAGAVVVAVDADYFVSGYDPAKLGKNGFLGLLGTDGVFRVRRTGDSVTAGDAVNYASAVPDADQVDPEVSLAVNSWDGVRRYTGTQQLFEFPLSVIVGLSESEQMAPARASERVYLWRAAMGSALLAVLTTALGRMSWQLARSRRRESEARLIHAQRVEFLAYHDGLTGLPNRSLFSKLLSQAISQAQRSNKHLAVAFIDLDRFKQINDTLGHETGDELLKQVALRLRAAVRDGDIVARLGGDEFVVMMTELAKVEDAGLVAQKIIAALAEPYLLLGQEFRVTASLGISTYPHDGRDEQTLTKNADIAMYQAKEDGKNNFQYYSEKLNANSLERLTLEASLRRALEHGEFRLYYQAKRDIATGRISGMEALLRWQNPDLGMVAPMKFLPIAEDTGLIVPIGKWVLKTACLQNVAWQKLGLPRLNIAVNLSPRQFHDEHLLTDIASILGATAMDPRLLEIEIHESLLIHGVDDTLRILTAIKGMGVKIAIDDFGAGYSSLTSLQRFPLDTIKIDRSFIRDITTFPSDSSLAKAIIAMGKRLSLTVVAQGVETEAQAEFLREHACDELQGFYFDRPVSTLQFTELLQAQTANVTYVGSRAALMKKSL